MRLTDPGFVFLLLPAAAGIYYCLPKRHKTAALAVLSAGFLTLMEPQYAGWLLLSLAFDCAVSAAMASSDFSPGAARALFVIGVGKNLALMAIFGAAPALFYGVRVPVGLMVVSLSSTDALIRQRRGLLPAPSVPVFAACALFFGRLVYGPVGGCKDLLPQLTRPKASLPMVGQGVMLLTLGLFKRVVLAEQLIALCDTLAGLPAERLSPALGWSAAVCGALALYYTLWAYSDIAAGIGRIFSIDLPAMLRYPMQAKGIREFIRRWNAPLFGTAQGMTGSGGRGLFPALAALLLGIWILPSAQVVVWAGLLALLTPLDRLVFDKIPTPLDPAARLATFLVTLPGYILLLPAPLSHCMALLGAMFGAGDAALYNDAVAYHLRSNAVLLLVALTCCWSLPEAAAGRLAGRFPRLWWLLSGGLCLAVLLVTASFLVWNAR
jgi:alginate O-acetyltransferase complex protein AlgI